MTFLDIEDARIAYDIQGDILGDILGDIQGDIQGAQSGNLPTITTNESLNTQPNKDQEPPPARKMQLLLLLNGFQRPRSDFRALRRRLHAQVPGLVTLALDHRGSGETNDGNLNASHSSIEGMSTDAKIVAHHVLTQVKLDSYSVLGISMGGMIAQTLAAQDKSVAKLILASTSSKGFRQRTAPIPLQNYFGRMFAASHTAMVDAFVQSVLKDTKSDEAKLRAAWQRTAIDAFDGGSQLPKILARTVIISGDDDAVVPHAHSEEIHRQLPHSELITYPQTGHILLVENPERFANDVATFLKL